jgi:ABC-type transporter MlaC component
MARFAIGVRAKFLKEEEKNKFIDCFLNMLVKLYASNFREYKSAELVVTGHREKMKNHFSVTSKVIIPRKPDVNIVWMVVFSEKEERFFIADAIIDEISIRQILKAEISGNISEKGLQQFLGEFFKKYEKL